MIYSRLAAPNTYTFAFPLRTVIRAGIDFRECGAQFYATANGRERRAPARDSAVALPPHLVH